jgi:predicted ATPase/DNA-binding SARP family transcriptional activator/DNA-binding CsgD family transcriptional regulator
MTHRRFTAQARSGSGEREAVRVWLLGGFRVSVGSRTVEGDRWRRRKAANLVKLLALAEGHRLHRERIMAVLWPDLDEKSAANNLHRVLHFARAALEISSAHTASRYLAFQGDLLALCPDGPLWVDVEAFEEAAATAHRTREPVAYRAAVDLYAGELLPEDRYEAWADERREALRETYLTLLTGLAELYEERAEYEPALEALRQALTGNPAHEEAHRGLMRIFAASGERERAIAQYEQLEKTLSEELGAEPAAASRLLHEEILAGRFPKAPSRSESRPSEESADPGHNLPNPRTSFVGREHEMVGVKRSLAMTGVLTLTGTGGSGKTRLALEVARDLVGAYPDGVWLVELAALSDPALVPQAVAASLGVREQPGQPLMETLSNHLGSKRTLLVLDNCEHLIVACARLVDALLNSCSGLRVLATSREALEVAGETHWPLSPLALPDAGQRLPPVEELARYEAIRLFLERARSRLPNFDLTQENARGVLEVCRKLDGIPLGIELATARLGALAVEQIVARLNDSLRLLTASSRTVEPRHRTLRATLAWSHDLLDEKERKLFGRLSVFAGSWTLEAAEEVCSGDGIEQDDVLNLLSRLVDKSLVVAEASPGAGEEVRYRMLETIRQYGRERLEAAAGTAARPEAERVRERHARYYLALAEEGDMGEAEPELKGARSMAWLQRMETEHGNLRAAVSWALDREGAGEHEELGLRLTVALFWFWHTHDYQSEGRRYLERALSGRSNPATARWRARALVGAAWLALFQADYGASKALVEEGMSIYRELGDREGIATGLVDLGYVAVLGERDDIPLPAVLEELEELKPELKNRNTIANLLILEGLVAGSRGDLERAATLHEESLELFREIRDVQGILLCLSHLGFITLLEADYERAGSVLREALRLAWETDYKVIIQGSIYVLAGVATCLEQPARAARLWGAVEGIQETYGVHLTPLARSIIDYEGLLTTARSQLIGEEEAFAAAWAEGKAMSLERAIEYALSTGEPAPPPTSKQPSRTNTDESPVDPLTRRQREVATLVGRGLTNSQIADALAISKYTAANHVAGILRKLNLPSRSQLAIWEREGRLRDPE